jgi:hypothetical protein
LVFPDRNSNRSEKIEQFLCFEEAVMLTQIIRGGCGGVRPPLFIFGAGAGAVVISESDQMTREIEKIADRFWHRARGVWLAWHTEKGLRNPGLKFQPM